MLALIGAWAEGCASSESTQLLVFMDTDYAVPGEVDRIHARVAKPVEDGTAGEEVTTWERTFEVAGTDGQSPAFTLPATFAVVPDGSDVDREVIVELSAFAPESETVLVSRRVRTGFVRGESVLVRVLLYRACAGVSCRAGQTCGCADASTCTRPSCVDETVPPTLLEPVDDPGALPPNIDFPEVEGTGGVGGGQNAAGGTGGTGGSGGMPVGGASGSGGSGGANCETPLQICRDECVNTQSDPRYCGDCDTACPSGFVCDGGGCIDPGDCSTNGVGCEGFTYCDEQSGQCLRGCSVDEQCPRDFEVCDLETRECVCSEGYSRCAFECVETDVDPRYCGSCDTSCFPGFVCEMGTCRDPGDCRSNGVGCSGFTYCDAESGRCLFGCEVDAQCAGANQVCDLSENECVCGVGFHECGVGCVSDLDVANCGTSCTPCPAPEGSMATCEAGLCDFVCDEDFVRCDDACCLAGCPAGQVLFDGSCAAFHVRTVDTQGNNGKYNSIQLSPAGVPHVAYYGESGKNLVFSIRTSESVWSRETAVASGEVGKYASLALGPGGLWSAAFEEDDEEQLWFATRQSSGQWTVEVVDDSDDVGEYASLAYDATGVAHVAYYDKSEKRLLHAVRRAEGEWDTDVVDESNNVGKYASLAFDDNDVAHIAYYDESDKDLRIAIQDPVEGWRIEVVDEGGDVGKYASLAFAPDGSIHVSYHEEGPKDLLVASRTGDSDWVVETVDSADDVGRYTSLAIAADGTVHISYEDESNDDLRYARRQPGGTWNVRTVDAPGEVGEHTSIVVDAAGVAHVAYYDKTNTNLKYAIIAGTQ